jgi:hypothetical protein
MPGHVLPPAPGKERTTRLEAKKKTGRGAAPDAAKSIMAEMKKRRQK